MSDARINPPTTLPSPPRMVRWTRNGKRNLIILRLFMIPFIAVGLFVPALVLLRLFTASYGTPIQATLDGKSITHTQDKNGPHTTYRVAYHYTLDGTVHKDRQQVGFDGYGNAHTGQQVAGRVTVILGHYYSLLKYGGVDSTNRFMALFTVFWDAVIFLCFVAAWIQPRRERRLVETGNVAVGSVSGCTASSLRRRMNYIMTYQFSTIDGATVTRKKILGGNSPIPNVGDPVTVLYDPAMPKRSLVYEYCNFEVAT